MAAAFAAGECGKRVTVVDDNPLLGGQIWRAELGRTKSAEAAELIDLIDGDSVRVVNSAQVFARSGERSLAAETSEGRTDFEFEKLIIATGARELFLPFPGWTLPGVFGAGGLQALVKGGFDVAGKRIVVAGSGPLLIAVAQHLKQKGAMVAAIVEQAPAAKLNRLALSLLASPAKLIQAARLKAALFGVPYYTGSWITAASSNGGPLDVAISSGDSKTRSIECDYVACGYHLIPNIELAGLLGCRIDGGFVAVDDLQQTSHSDIYCTGEPTGIGGLDASLIEGRIAGYAAAGQTETARSLFAKRDKTRRFTSALNQAFALRDDLKTLADESTIVCRCEDVQYRQLTGFDNWRSAKLQTRCGMGPCQGRVCGAAAEFLFGWTIDPPRPPILPVKLENL